MPGSLPCFDHTLRDNGCPACDDDGGKCNICGCVGHDPQPAPAPLPEEVAEAKDVLSRVQDVLRDEDMLFAAEGLRVVFGALDSQARRLAEAEAELKEANQFGSECVQLILVHTGNDAEIDQEFYIHHLREILDEHNGAMELAEKNATARAEAAELRAAVLTQERDGLSSLCEQHEARVRELEAQIAASKKNERRWIAKGEEAIAERNAANTALEAIKKHQEIVAGTGAAQMSTTWKIADAHLRSIGSTRAALAATDVK